MKIQKFTNRNRRDFTAIYECEHCESTKSGGGYDDDNFHNNVIPAMVCGICGKSSPTGSEPLTTKYAANEII